MRCLSPVDEERRDSVGNDPVGIGELPRQHGAARAPSASAKYAAELDPFLSRVGDHGGQIAPLGRPCHEARRRQVIDAKPTRLIRLGLLGVGSEDLEVRRWAEGEYGVASPLAWMLPTRCGSYTEPLFQLVNGRSEVWRCIDEVINAGHESTQALRLGSTAGRQERRLTG